MIKKLFSFVFVFGIVLCFVACGQTADTISEDTAINSFVSLETNAETSSKTMPETSVETSSLETPESQSIPSATESSHISDTPDNSTPEKNNERSNPPTTSTPSQTQSEPATSKPIQQTSSSPPRNSTPPESSTSIPPTISSAPPETSSNPSKPTYTEADYQAIINEIRSYGEAKGFVWNADFTFGMDGLGYYGRPNLTDDGYEGVISMLKFHCDKIERQYGECYFKVIKHLYEGKIEFIVLYA